MKESDAIEKQLEKARGGDRHAFDGLISASRDGLEVHIRRRLGDHLRQVMDADDVYQESVARALASVSRCRCTDATEFLRWLRGIAEHVILNVARRKRGDKLLYMESDAPCEQPSPSRAARQDERFDRLRAALEVLSPEYRTVVQLVRIEGLQVKEAALRMNRTPKSVMHLLSRALKQLRDRFGDTESLSLPPRTLVEGENRDGD